MARSTKGFIIGHESCCNGTYVLRSTMLYYGVPGGDIEKRAHGCSWPSKNNGQSIML